MNGPGRSALVVRKSTHETAWNLGDHGGHDLFQGNILHGSSESVGHLLREGKEREGIEMETSGYGLERQVVGIKMP